MIDIAGILVRAIALAISTLAVAWSATTGQVLTDSVSPMASPVMACDVPTRSYDEIAALLEESGVATPAATTGGQTLPQGVPASSTSAAVMERLVRQWLACQNAGESLRAWSLFSDGYLFRLLWRQGTISEDAYRDLSTPTPAGTEPARLVSVEGQRLLPDGRYGATIVITYPSVPMPKRFFFYFTEVEDRLLIDGILGEISFSIP